MLFKTCRVARVGAPRWGTGRKRRRRPPLPTRTLHPPPYHRQSDPQPHPTPQHSGLYAPCGPYFPLGETQPRRYPPRQPNHPFHPQTHAPVGKITPPPSDPDPDSDSGDHHRNHPDPGHSSHPFPVVHSAPRALPPTRLHLHLHPQVRRSPPPQTSPVASRRRGPLPGGHLHRYGPCVRTTQVALCGRTTWDDHGGTVLTYKSVSHARSRLPPRSTPYGYDHDSAGHDRPRQR